MEALEVGERRMVWPRCALYFWSVAVNYRASYGITRVNRGYMHAALSGRGGTSGFGLS